MKTYRMFHFVLVILTGAFFLCFSSAALCQNEIVSFNTATVERLMAIKGVEVSKTVARAIVAYREKNGPFKMAADLNAVPGMTHDLFKELNPVTSEDGSDVVYDPDTEPVVAPLKS